MNNRKKEQYRDCWYCDNIISHQGMAGVMYLGFPRCFVLTRELENFEFCSFDEFSRGKNVEINWLDPSDKATSTERMEVLRILYNFYIEVGNEEERIYGEHYEE